MVFASQNQQNLILFAIRKTVIDLEAEAAAEEKAAPARSPTDREVVSSLLLSPSRNNVEGYPEKNHQGEDARPDGVHGENLGRPSGRPGSTHRDDE
jgi:hypothetical protein